MARDAYFETHPATPRRLFGTATVYKTKAEAERAGRRVAREFDFVFVETVRYRGGWSPVWKLTNRKRD